MPTRQETTAVKKVLKAAGMPIRSVRADTGTASYWVVLTFAHGTPRAIQEEGREIARVTLGRRPDVNDGGDTTHNECISVQNESARL